jgi:hypothetical protein
MSGSEGLRSEPWWLDLAYHVARLLVGICIYLTWIGISRVVF